jgi:hypothetical protein
LSNLKDFERIGNGTMGAPDTVRTPNELDLIC